MRTLSRRDFAVLAASAPLLSRAAIAATARGALSRAQVQTIEAILKKLVASGIVPGISYSIGNAAETLTARAFGLRVVGPPARMERTTRSALASVSKQFASAAIYLLHQHGALSLDAPLSTYLPDYKYAKEMTLHQVLTMRAGVTANDDACEAPVDGKIDAAALVANLNKHKLDFPPSKYFAYTNCGYNIAGLVVERASRQTYGDFLAKNFFQPLGMSSSYVLGARNDPNFAQGYAREANRWKSEPPTAADRAFASGNLVSTPDDMQRWSRSLLNATILSRKSLQEIFAVPTSGGSAHLHYASGWFVEPSGVRWHGGTLAGYATVNMLIPRTGHAIALLSNTGPSKQWKPEEVAREIYNAASLGPPLPPFLKRVRTTAPS